MIKRFKMRYEFWLEDKPDHALVAEVIESMKKERAFASAVRDGLMLIADLRKGSIDLLLRLFPWIDQAVLARHPEMADLPSQNELAALRSELDALRAWVTIASIQQAAGQGPKPMTVPDVPRPAVDDADDTDLLIVKKAEGSGGKSANNFLESAFNLLG